MSGYSSAKSIPRSSFGVLIAFTALNDKETQQK